jgi:hypothetical protein
MEDNNMNTSTKTLTELVEGDVVITLGNTTFTKPANVTKVRRHNGRTVAVITANGGFWPIGMVPANTPAVVVAQ